MDADPLERRVVSKVSWRLLPYLFLLYVVAYVDRINVGVAQLRMSEDLSLDAAVFGAGAGIFFIGYFLFEVPSNMVLARVGARLWIARIMIFWGIVSIAMMFVTGVKSFYALRFLLGAAEAGFFPGILYYLTKWFRAKDRARAISLFMTAGTLAGVLNPVSGALLGLEGTGGLRGWQWLFLIEGIPAVLLGFSVMFLLTETPESARWLKPEECAWLADQLARERAGKSDRHASTLLAALKHPVVWHLTAIYFLLVCGAYGFEFWLPGIVKSLNKGSDFQASLLSAIPSVVAAIAMVVIGQHSDRTGERRWHVVLTLLASSLCFFISAHLRQPVAALAALSLAWAGLKSVQGPFWAIPPTFLTGPAAAGGIALINSVANLGGQVGPWLVGLLRKHTGNFSAGLFVSAGFLLVSGLIALTLRPPGKSAEPSAPDPSN